VMLQLRPLKLALGPTFNRILNQLIYPFCAIEKSSQDNTRIDPSKMGYGEANGWASFRIVSSGVILYQNLRVLLSQS
jgi:hypothetical protein